MSPPDVPDVTVSMPASFNIYKNLAVLSCSVVFLFTAFNGLMSLQSSLNSDSGLGPTSLSVVSMSVIVSCMFTPTLVIAKLGSKKTIVYSALFYSVYVIANVNATWWTLIPASVVFGIGVAPLWSAKCSYIAAIAREHSQRRCENEEVIANRFFAFYTIVAASSHIWGNIISAVVLKAPPHKDTGEILIPEARLQVCGSKTVLMGLGLDVFYFAMFKVTDQPSGDQITSLCYVYLICTIFPVFSIAIFLDKVPRPVTGSGRNPPLCGLLVATLHQLRDYRQLLLIPITTYAGLAGAFIHSDFSKAFVSCSLGVHYVGLVMMVFGISSSVTTFVFSFARQWVGRLSLFISGVAINVAIMTLLLLGWSPNHVNSREFYVLGVLWGMGDCVWHSQLLAFYGTLWPQDTDAAFSNFRLWNSIGHIIGFQWTNFLCVRIKLIILLTTLCTSFGGYLAVEAFELRSPRKSSSR